MQKSQVMMIAGALILLAGSVQLHAIQLSQPPNFVTVTLTCSGLVTILFGWSMLITGWWKRD